MSDGFRTPKTGTLWGRLKPGAQTMRHEPTEAENVLWQRLRRNQIAGHHFRRQHVIDRFIVDFYYAKARLVIEVDVAIHAESGGHDAVRQDYLESMGLCVLRFTNEQVLHEIDHVVTRICEFIAEN